MSESSDKVTIATTAQFKNDDKWFNDHIASLRVNGAKKEKAAIKRICKEDRNFTKKEKYGEGEREEYFNR